jgi:hypothetical protein
MTLWWMADSGMTLWWRMSFDVHFHVGGAEDVAGALEADADVVAFVVDEGVPGLVFERDEAAVHFFEEALDELAVAREADLQGVFDHQRQQPGRGHGAEDRAPVAGGEQVRQAADVVDVHVGDDQRQHVVHREGDAVLFEMRVRGGTPVGACLARESALGVVPTSAAPAARSRARHRVRSYRGGAGSVLALEQAAIDEQRAIRRQLQAVAAAGDASGAAVVG